MRGFRIFCQAGEGGGGSMSDGQKTVWTIFFFSHQLILQFTEWIQWFYYRGEEGSNFFQGAGVSKESHITCDFPWGGGGPDPLTPLWIRTWGRLTPLFAYRIIVYQNITEKIKQVIWVSIGYKQLDPLEKVGPPPP